MSKFDTQGTAGSTTSGNTPVGAKATDNPNIVIDIETGREMFLRTFIDLQKRRQAASNEVGPKQVPSVPPETKETKETPERETNNVSQETTKTTETTGDKRFLYEINGEHKFQSEFGSEFTQKQTNEFRGVGSIINPNAVLRIGSMKRSFFSSDSHLRILDTPNNPDHIRNYRLSIQDPKKKEDLDNWMKNKSGSEVLKNEKDFKQVDITNDSALKTKLNLGNDATSIISSGGRYVVTENDPNLKNYNFSTECSENFKKIIEEAKDPDLDKYVLDRFSGKQIPGDKKTIANYKLTVDTSTTVTDSNGEILTPKDSGYWVQQLTGGKKLEDLSGEQQTKIDNQSKALAKGMSCPGIKEEPQQRNRLIDTPDIQDTEGLKQYRGIEPTVDNLCDQDVWGKTNKHLVYDYVDFLYSRWYNKIPNNRLITLRRFLLPVGDTTLTHQQLNPEQGQENHIIAKAITYFGEETGNSLQTLTSFNTGLNWGEKNADVQKLFMKNYLPDTDPSNAIGQGLANGITAIGAGISKAGLGPVGDTLSTVGSAISSISSGIDYLAQFLNPVTMGQASGYDQDLADFDPYENGDFSDLTWGPLNVIDSTKVRKRGLKFSHNITLKFEYQLRSIGKINPKVAMLDIMANLFLLCSSNARFWGGGLRFFQWMPKYPLNSDMNDLMNSLKSGNILTKDSSLITAWTKKFFNTIDQGLTKLLGTDGNKYGTSGRTYGQEFQNALDEFLSKRDNASAEKLKDISGQIKTKVSAEGIESAAKNGSEFAKDLGRYFVNTTVLEGVRAQFKSLIMPIKGILTGAPVGEWHLVVGNPFHPIMMIGNLICAGVSIDFNGSLGVDDFPEFLSASVQLEHGMPRDKGGIESVFNYGEGKLYYGYRDTTQYNKNSTEQRRRRFRFSLDDLQSAKDKQVQENALLAQSKGNATSESGNAGGNQTQTGVDAVPAAGAAATNSQTR